MAIEIVDLSINSMVIFHNHVSLPEGNISMMILLTLQSHHVGNSQCYWVFITHFSNGSFFFPPIKMVMFLGDGK
jgi:hypothetical protein